MSNLREDNETPGLPEGATGSSAAGLRDSADRLERSLAELEREKRVVDTLYRVAQAVAGRDDLREIVQLVTDETTAITGAQFGAFFYNTVRRDGEILALYTISGVPRASFDKFPMPRATEIFRPTFAGSANVRIDDVRADPRFGRNPPYNGMPRGHLPVRSYLAVPVFGSDGGVVGGLVLGHEDVAVFSEEHERIATGIATQAGTAIEKARLLASEREARAEAEARADAAVSLEFVEDGVVMVDSDGVIRLWNRAAETITGLTADSVLGRTIGEAVPGWERIALDVPVSDPAHRAPPATLPLDTLQGRELWLSVYGVTFGEGTVYAFRDVTGEHELETLRADVISTVSHELRTPVSSIYGVAQTLLRHNLDREVSDELLQILGSESERLTVLVDEILLTSQIDSGTIRPAKDKIDPLRTITAATRSAAVGHDNVSIVVEAPDTVPPIAADEDKLRQVLANLLENAVKYGTDSDGGTIVVGVRVHPDKIRFEVRDHGPGVPARERTRIFEKFYRVDPQMRQGLRGTGLGLYICRELVYRMQGRIGIESADQNGSTFWFELPRY